MITININECTPVEQKGGYYLKRDDKFTVMGVCGGKARSAYQIITKAMQNGFRDFVTAGSRMSPQCELVSYLCESMDVNCHLFMPRGKETSVISNINKNKRSTIHRTKVGYNSVICKNARDYAETNNYFYIPFGMECEENIEVTKHQVVNIPKNIGRIVIPVGSGMSLISVLNGLEFYGMHSIEVLGIQVGKDPSKNLKKYLNAPNIKYTIIKSDLDYEQFAKEFVLQDVELDRIYEAKCIPYLKKGDLLWIVGKRK